MPNSNLSGSIMNRFPNIVLEAYLDKGNNFIIVKKEGLRNFMFSLKNEAEFGFDMLMDLFVVDYLHWEEKEFRFEVIYNLYSSKSGQRLFVKVLIRETEAELDSVTPLWPAANWYEREAWDMFGIRFNGHPNLKRILMYEEFQGHALRKDYPYNKRQPLVGPVN